MPKDQKNLISRPPVVVVMGHIDHGKSTLLDFIRKSNVVAGEAGGITQHVGAYQAEHVSADGKKHPITFIDTPGHAAFGGIRTRGALAADIAILAVSAEDGVKPQTIEAFKVIQAAKIPYVVAITKTDKPNANVDKAKQSLGENEIYVEGWGGDVPNVAVSATTGAGMPELMDMLILVSELADLKTDPSAPAKGLVVESTLDTRKGISATLLVKEGTLTTGTVVVAGGSYAPVRFIEDFKGNKIESATASVPVQILGWNVIPASGLEFITVATKKKAEEITSAFTNDERRLKNSSASASQEAAKKSQANSAGTADAADTAGTADDPKKEAEPLILPVILKADVIGSLEGVKFELAKIPQDKVRIKITSEGIGDINDNDVKLAMSDPTILVVGFNASPDKKSAAMIERSPVPLNVKSFNIIYELSEYVNAALAKMIPKEYVEEVTGRAKILALFSKDRDKQVIGGKVESGTVMSGNDVRILRREVEVGRGKIRELQSKKLRVEEVATGFEFGMMVESKIEIAAGDRVEAVRTVEKI